MEYEKKQKKKKKKTVHIKSNIQWNTQHPPSILKPFKSQTRGLLYSFVFFNQSHFLVTWRFVIECSWLLDVTDKSNPRRCHCCTPKMDAFSWVLPTRQPSYKHEMIEPPHDKTTYAPSEDSDQPGHPPSLISPLSAWRNFGPLTTYWAKWRLW